MLQTSQFRLYPKISVDVSISYFEKDAQIKLMEKDKDSQIKLMTKDANFKIALIQRIISWQTGRILAIAAIIVAALHTLFTYSGKKVQKKSVDAQKSATSIYSKQQVDAILQKYSTTPLKVPNYYVQIPQLNNEVQRSLKFLDYTGEKHISMDTFQVLTGFSGYGKTTAFAKCINRLRDEAQKTRDQRNTLWNRLMFWKPKQFDRIIYYISLKETDQQPQAQQQQKAQKLALDKKLRQLIVLLRAVARMPLELQKCTTIVIDDINRMFLNSENQKQRKLLENAYFSRIWTLSSKRNVNIICISNSRSFSDQLEDISQVRKQAYTQYLPLPTNQQREQIIKKCLKFYAKDQQVPTDMSEYFLTNYSSIKNFTNIIKRIYKRQNYHLNVNKSQWIKNLEQIEQQYVQRTQREIEKHLNSFNSTQARQDCKTVIKCLLKDYKLQKTTKRRKLYLHYPQIKGVNLQSKILDKLSDARVIDYGQIISEIDKWAFERYYNKLDQNLQSESTKGEKNNQ